MHIDELVANLARAEAAMTRAEKDLEKAIGELAVAPRASKVAISTGLEAAFTEVRSARAEIVRIEALLTEGRLELP